MQFHVYHHADERVLERLARIERMVIAMATEIQEKIDVMLEKVKKQTTDIKGIGVTLDEVRAMVKDIVGSPSLKAKVDELFDALVAQDAAIQAAIDENVTPEEPPPNPEP